MNFTRETMESTLNVTPEQVKSVLRQRIQPLFNDGGVRMVMATNPATADDVVDAFKKKGFEVEKIDVDKINPDEM